MSVIRLDRKYWEKAITRQYRKSLKEIMPYYAWDRDEKRCAMHVYLLAPDGQIYTCIHLHFMDRMGEDPDRMLKAKGQLLWAEIHETVTIKKWRMKDMIYIDVDTANRIQEAIVNGQKSKHTN